MKKIERIVKRIISLAIMTLLTLGLALPQTASVSMAASVESYSYSITPIIAPLNNLYYVKTNNPDPTSFRLVDNSSKYVSKKTDDTGIVQFLDE